MPDRAVGLREKLRRIGAHARRHRLRAAMQLARAPVGPLALNQLVTMAAQEYYGPKNAPSSPPVQL